MKCKYFAILLITWPLLINAASKDNELREGMIKLSTLTGVNQIELTSTISRYAISLPLSKRIALSDYTLHLELVNSISLLEHRSQLVVMVNKIVISQINLTPHKPRVLAEIPIAAEYLTPGYNSIEFLVNQHYTEGCEDPAARELWTQINTDKSYFEFVYQMQPNHFTIADLTNVFDEHLPEYEITLMMATDEYDDRHLHWGSLVTQGVALYQKYKTPDFKLATAQHRTPRQKNKSPYNLSNYALAPLDQSKFTGDVVLIGNVNELAPYLTLAQAKKINGPYIAVVPAKNPIYQVIIISGQNDDEVNLAAESFAFARQPFPDDNDITVLGLQLPDIDQNKLPYLLQPHTSYAFSELGFNSQTLTNSPTSLQVNIPPDLLNQNQELVELKLNLAFGAALREDSVLNIYLNGLFERAIRLENSAGARYTDYKVTIPLSSFLPGANTFTFEPVMPPLVTGNGGACSLVQTKNAKLTIYDNSTIKMPDVDHFVSLPNLNLLRRTGYPYTQSAYGLNMGVVIRDRHPDTMLAAWQFMAKLAQQATFPLSQARISFNTLNERDLIIISSQKMLHDTDISGAPLQMKGKFQLPFQRNNILAPLDLNWFEKIFGATNASPQPASLTMNASLGRQAIMISYANSQAADKLITLITADTPEQLHRSIRDLVSPEIWGRLSDDLVIWNKDENLVITQQVGDDFYRGQTSTHNQLAYHFSNHLYQWLGGIIILIIGFSWLVHRWLNRFKARQHKESSELDT